MVVRQVLEEHIRRLHASHAYARIAGWLMAAAAHPWARACGIAWCHAFAFLVGDTFEDERVAFSKRRLVASDAYRDRLLAPEISDLVDLCEALRLSIAQRKAFFRCFLHLDYLRRAGVSRTELLRYCALRDAPVAHTLLPSDGAFAVAASAHRSDEFRTQRWDILQLLALAFSLCTMETATLINLCCGEIEARAERDEEDETSAFASRTETNDDDENARTKESGSENRDRLMRHIDACLAFSYGVPSPVEQSLAVFLRRLYSDGGGNGVDFVGVHGVEQVADVITLFPVLLFPCVWLQRVIRRRVMGDATWQKLAVRRAELQLAGLPVGFASAADILAASEAHGQHRDRQAARPRELSPSQERPEASLSTPRKILPVADEQHPREAARPPHSWTVDVQNNADAWRATADSVLATAFVYNQTSGVDGAPGDTQTTQDAAALFEHTRREIQSCTLSPSSVASIQRQLIHGYGYQFMAFVFANSSVREAGGELVCTSSVHKELKRAAQRHRKADDGLSLVEDKAVYWKEYSDPVLKRVFYHNVRSGESRWEMPSTVLAKRRKKKKRSPTKNATSNRDFV